MDYIPKHTTKVNMAGTSNPHTYVEKANLSKQIDTAVLHNIHIGLKHDNTPESVEMFQHHCYSAKVASHLHSRCTDSPVVTEVVRVLPDMLPSTKMMADP